MAVSAEMTAPVSAVVDQMLTRVRLCHGWERLFLTQVNCGRLFCVKLLHLTSLRVWKGLLIVLSWGGLTRIASQSPSGKLPGEQGWFFIFTRSLPCSEDLALACIALGAFMKSVSLKQKQGQDPVVINMVMNV